MKTKIDKKVATPAELLGTQNEVKTTANYLAGRLEISQHALSKTDISQLLQEIAFEPPLIPNLENLAARIENISTAVHETAACAVKPSV